MSRIFRRQSAREDLVEIVFRYMETGSPFTGHRFREAAEKTFQRLALMPGLGSRLDLEHHELSELRYFPLPTKFKKFIVFYRPVDGRIEIARVPHGSRDLHGILEKDFGVSDEDDAKQGETGTS